MSKKVPTLLYNIHCIIKRVLVTIPMFICKVNLGATIILSILWSNMCSYFFGKKISCGAYLILLFVYLNLIFRKLQIMYFEETHNQRSIQIKKKQVWHNVSLTLNLFLELFLLTSSPWKLVTNYVLEWMRLNFYDNHGLEPKMTNTKHYYRQCSQRKMLFTLCE